MAEKLDMGPRLRAIAALVPEGCGCLADIGTDHGYIPVSLLLEERVGRAVAADIGALPLDHARRTAAQYGVKDNLDFRLGDGLAVLEPGEADVIVVAGMGGDAVTEILAAAPWSRAGPLLLLQPMSKAEVLRAWLPLNGYEVSHEELVQDKGVLYPILTVRGGGMPPASDAQAWGGFLLERDPLWGLYIADRLLRLRRAAAGLEKARDPSMAEKREKLLGVIAQLEEKEREWERANAAGH
ncbi:MAG: SAM-dependent methyltransferase [Oscillibacter sp.]|nr:SAM-dependent methyltransferase [Oscillibacter sp.]